MTILPSNAGSLTKVQTGADPVPTSTVIGSPSARVSPPQLAETRLQSRLAGLASVSVIV